MTPNHKILIVDDDVNICQLMNLYLAKESFQVSICHNGKEALKLLTDKKNFDIVLLDIMMPEMDGFETLAEIRKFSSVPVIMVSAKDESMDKISSLDIGADDYVTKPFEPQELISRIKALIRRSRPTKAGGVTAAGDIVIDNISINMAAYEVRVGGIKQDMPPKEIEILYYLVSNPNKVHTREELLKQIWGPQHKGDARTVDVHIKRIRTKIGSSSRWNLETVWRIGYKFDIF